MKREMRKWVALLLIPFVLVMTFGTTPVQAESKLGIHVDGAILIDADTGKILYEENADTPLGIASMTKMMTEYLLI